SAAPESGEQGSYCPSQMLPIDHRTGLCHADRDQPRARRPGSHENDIKVRPVRARTGAAGELMADKREIPDVVLAAGVLATSEVSFLLVGSAALWLRGEQLPIADVDAVVEPGEANLRRLHEALTALTIRPGPIPTAARDARALRRRFKN